MFFSFGNLQCLSPFPSGYDKIGDGLRRLSAQVC